MKVAKPKVCSLFAGIGGIDLAFAQAGFEIVWANEIDKDACKTYRHNFPDTILSECDIGKIKAFDPVAFTYALGVFQHMVCMLQRKRKNQLRHRIGAVRRNIAYHNPPLFCRRDIHNIVTGRQNADHLQLGQAFNRLPVQHGFVGQKHVGTVRTR